MNIVYATDGSPDALAGAAFLAQLPLDKSSKIRLLTVVSKEEEEAARADQTLDEACLVLSDSGARYVRSVRHGHAADEILHEAADNGADLIVVGHKGRSAVARFFLGSVAEWVARHASCAVLVARPASAPPRTVLVGVDNSAGAELATHFLATLPLPPGCRLHLVSVVFPDAAIDSSRHMLLPHLSDQIRNLARQERVTAHERLSAAATLLSSSGFEASAVTTDVRTGVAATELLAAAEESGADLVVVGAQGLSALDRFLIGSVAERLLRHASCSVLCVR